MFRSWFRTLAVILVSVWRTTPGVVDLQHTAGFKHGLWSCGADTKNPYKAQQTESVWMTHNYVRIKASHRSFSALLNKYRTRIAILQMDWEFKEDNEVEVRCKQIVFFSSRGIDRLGWFSLSWGIEGFLLWLVRFDWSPVVAAASNDFNPVFFPSFFLFLFFVVVRVCQCGLKCRLISLFLCWLDRRNQCLCRVVDN